ncbi:RNA-directed DNA polymerase, eukaryota [Tanacetum coccineum]
MGVLKKVMRLQPLVTPTKVESNVDFEDDDEVIVFKPTVIDNRTEMLAQKESHQEGLQHVQNKETGLQLLFQSNNSQVTVSIAGELKGLTLMESGHVAKELWSTCVQHRTVTDVYIPKNVSKQGKPFAFARFIKVTDVDLLIKNLRTNAKHLILESFKVSIKGKVITIRAKEVTGWVPDFGKTDSDINSVSIHNWEDTDDDDVVIPDSFQGYDFGNTHKDKSDHERSYAESVPKEVNDHASDPFGLDGLILKSAKKHAKIPHLKSDSDPTFPPGFTPDISLQPDNAAEKVTKESTPLSSPIHAKNDSPIVHEVEESNNNMGKVTGSEHIEISKEDHHDSMSRSSKPINGFSILDRFQEFIDIGQTMGYGLGGKEKKKWVKNLCHSNQVNLLSLQETKMVSLDIFVVRALWGNMLFDFATSSARGRSGGILCVWDKTLFQKKRTYATDSCLCVEGTWLATKSDLLFISVYSPQELNLKRVLWSYISGIISRWHGDVVVMGDFNEVRFASERYGSSFHALNFANFNSFIANSNLIDIPLGGYSYTWADKYASNMSKLDRFLVSQGIVDLFPNLTGLVLHRNISDHRPILLKESHVDYGPTPFRLFHSWFSENDFCNVVEDSWKNDGTNDMNAMVLLKNKLKCLKQKLKSWSIVKKRSKESNRKSLQETIIQIDQRIDNGITLPDDLANRSTAIRELHSIDKQSDMDAAQRAKVTWAIEGDENYKYFNGIVNKKRRHLAIKGILIDGDWIDDPARVKSEFFKHFANQFSDPGWSRAPFDGQFLNLLDPIQSNDLESDISNEEIKKSVWDCGSDKSPGPDGFTFDFF